MSRFVLELIEARSTPKPVCDPLNQTSVFESPRAAAILLHWGSVTNTEAALSSLNNQDTPVHVFVVDQVGDFAATGYQRPGVSVLRPAKNLGFSGGVNLALRAVLQGPYEYVLLFNNDATAAADLLRLLSEALDRDEKAAAAGPTILYSLPANRVWYGGGRYSPRRATVNHTAVGAEYETMLRREGAEARSVTFITGCALMLRLEAVRQLGQFDDRFFVYWEDADWCARAIAEDWRLLYVPRAVATHEVSQSLGVDSSKYLYYILRNHLLFINKHTALVWRPLAYTSPALVALRALAMLPRRCRRDRRQMVWLMVRACRDAVFNRYGPLPER